MAITFDLAFTGSSIDGGLTTLNVKALYTLDSVIGDYYTGTSGTKILKIYLTDLLDVPYGIEYTENITPLTVSGGSIDINLDVTSIVTNADVLIRSSLEYTNPDNELETYIAEFINISYYWRDVVPPVVNYLKKYYTQFTTIDNKVHVLELWQKVAGVREIKYGYIYNWYAATNAAGIAPDGWHVPTKTELETLAATLGGISVAGGKLKETGLTYWRNPNTNATNEVDFNFRGSGYRFEVDGNFQALTEQGIIIGSTLESALYPYGLRAYYDSELVEITYYNKLSGFAIRLIKDDSTDPGTMTDFDGNIYQTVKIGSQVWMAENLIVTHYKDGTPIQNITDNTAWASLTTGAYCAYDNDINNAYIDVVPPVTAEEVQCLSMPFSVEMPELDHKFQVIRGTGCEINLLSTSNMKFIDGLYHVDPQEFLIKDYVDDALFWTGYLNSEMYREPFSELTNYPIQVTGNDGFALMERFNFVQTDKTHYTGIKSKWELLQIVFDRINLPFVRMRVNISTTASVITINANDTLLHHSYIDCANFYDEDNAPMTMRQVLESILAPYGCFIMQVEGDIIINDIHTLATGATFSYKNFDMSDWSYIDTTSITNNVKNIQDDIQFAGTATEIERSGGVNKQVIAYSPYPIKGILDQSIGSYNEFSLLGLWSTKNGYYYRNLYTNQFWVDAGGIPDLKLFEASREGTTGEENIYIMLPYSTGNVLAASMIQTPTLVLPASITGISPDKRITYGTNLKITAEILYRYGNPYYSEPDIEDVSGSLIYFKIKIGDYYWNQLTAKTGEWTLTDSFAYIYTNTPNNRVVTTNSWFDIGYFGNGYLIPINQDLSGELSIELYTKNEAETVANGGDPLELWLKNISVEITNSTGSEISDSDVEYIGYLDETYKNEGEKITLFCGTEVSFSDRGKILYNNGTIYKPIQTWTRNSQTFKIEELLLGSVSSNYRAGFVTLNSMKLNNAFNNSNVLTDDYLTGKKFMVKSSKVNFRDNLVECNLVEVTPDELIIVK